MRLATTIPQYDLRAVTAAAQAAERTGFDSLVTLENRNDPFLALAVAAVGTDRIGLGTSVAIAFPRSPMVVANAAWDLQVASRGRFVLGLGPQIRPHNEKRFSVPWSAPVPRMRDYVGALRAIWTAWQTGGKLDYRSKHYTFTLMTPNFVPVSYDLPMVPITLAAVGLGSLRLAGEVGDGVSLHPFCTRRYAEEVAIPHVLEGLAKSGRTREHFHVSGGGFIATGPDEDAMTRMVDWVRMRIAFYGSTPAYWPVLDLHGLDGLGHELNALSKQGRWSEMPSLISDTVVELFAAVGTHDQIVTAIERRFGRLTDTLYASVNSEVPSDLPPGLVQDIGRIPTPFTGYLKRW